MGGDSTAQDNPSALQNDTEEKGSLEAAKAAKVNAPLAASVKPSSSNSSVVSNTGGLNPPCLKYYYLNATTNKCLRKLLTHIMCVLFSLP